MREQLGIKKILNERAHCAGANEGGKDRTIVVKLSSYKGRQRVLTEARCQKREDIYVHEDFSKATSRQLGKKTGRK